MTHETLDLVELGQAEALIEFCCGDAEEVLDKLTPRTGPYVEFENLKI